MGNLFLVMSQKKSYEKRSSSKKEQKFCLCLYIMDDGETREEEKTVVPENWVDGKNGFLWWPDCDFVTKKIDSYPEDTWHKFELIKVLLTGERSLCEEMLNLPSSSETDMRSNTPPQVKTQKPLPRMPAQSEKSILPFLKDSKRSQRRSRSPFKMSSHNKKRKRNRSIFDSESSRSPSPESLSPPRSRHEDSPSVSFSLSSPRSRSRSRSPLLNSSKQQSTSHSHESKLQSSRKDSAKSLKEKLPIDNAEFQYQVLTSLKKVSASSNRKVGCMCPCFCDNGDNKHVNNDFKTIDSLEEFFALESKLQRIEHFDTMVSQLKRFGGKDAKAVTKNIMSRWFTNDLMSLFNFTGKNRGNAKKKSFRDKKICEAIMESVRQQVKATEADIKELIADNLRFAPFKKRKGGSETENIAAL